MRSYVPTLVALAVGMSTARLVKVTKATVVVYSSAGGINDTSFVKSGTTPTCPADLFDQDLVTVTCFQGEQRERAADKTILRS